MEFERKVGYVLLSLGIFLMFVSLLTALLVFSGAKSPPRLFEIQKPSGTLSVAGIEMPAMEVIPIDYLNLSGNLMFFLAFMFFSVSVSGKISMVGVSLIKEPRKTT